MRFLTTESNSSLCINLDSIQSVEMRKVKDGHIYADIPAYAIGINKAIGLYVGDFTDVKLRYVNLMEVLSSMDIPSSSFVANNYMVVMKNDGTFSIEDSSLWSPDIKESDFDH